MKCFQRFGRRPISDNDDKFCGEEEERRAYNERISRMRTSEYPMLQDLTYLDHGGTTLAPKSLLKSFCDEMQSTLLANPHSDSSNPSVTAVMVAQTRLAVLDMFNADPAHFDVVFTANATGAIKLVTEGFSGHEDGFDYCYHRNSHTSLVGVRELAHHSHCFASNEETEDWLAGANRTSIGGLLTRRPVLFAYPAQSNMNGERLPLDWTGKLRFSLHHPNSYSLLDVAALVSTTSIDLSNHLFAPDFIALSFYKIFGFPDLGALIVRKAAGHVFDKRRYFGGGTTEMTTCLEESWVARKESSLHARLEDGTIAFRNILALKCAITTHRRLFGGLGEVSTHASWLARILHERLTSMTHYNGAPVCQIYKAEDSDFHNSQTQGPTIAFNVRRSDGTYIGPWHVGAFLRASRIHVRTGNVCNPAGIACALGVKPGWLRGAFDAGFRCNTQADLLEGVPIGIVRVTLGAISTLEDVNLLVSCLSQSVVEHRDHLHETAQVYSKKKEWTMGSRSPSPVSESSTIRIEPAPPGSEKPMTVFKNPRSLVPWWIRRKRLNAHLKA